MSKEQEAFRGGPGPGGPFGLGEVEHAEQVGQTLLRICAYFAREKRMVLGMLGVVLASTVCGIYAPSAQSRAVDIISGEGAGTLGATVALMLLGYLLYSAGQLVQGLISAHLSQRIVRQMRQDLFNRIIGLPVRYMDTHAHGDLISRMTNDIESVSTTVSQSLPSLFSGVLTVVGTAAVMAWYCWQLALLSMVTVVLTVVVTKLLSKYVRRTSRRRQELLGRLNSVVEEMISGYRTVTVYNRQEQTAKDFAKLSDEMTKAGIQTDAVSGIMGPLSNSIGNIGFVIIAAFGGYFSYKGLISVGVISAFIVYARQFSRPINELAQVYGQLQTAVAGAERVFRVLDEAEEDRSGEALETGAGAAVSFRNLVFSYRPGHPVLQGLSLDVPPGKKVALVGATGCGKTTVVNLLLRFYDPDSGEICINGQRIDQVSLDSLRKTAAVVLQDTVLFTGTLRENLRYNRADATDQEILDALELSSCSELVGQLPQGLDTVLTASGASLSQGQRQLLAIARAFVADPQILILDEATSNVDTQTEQAIQDAMRRVMERRTSIIIAHRLSTIRDADVIVVLDQGQISEMGSHDALLAQKGKYYELYMTQYAGFAT